MFLSTQALAAVGRYDDALETATANAKTAIAATVPFLLLLFALCVLKIQRAVVVLAG